MKKHILIFGCLAFIGCAALSHRNYAQYGRDRVARVRVVFEDPTKGVQGSGTIIGSKGYVLTAYHVARYAESPNTHMMVKTTTGQIESCILEKIDKPRDLALLHCAGLKGHSGVDKIAKKIPAVGDFIFAVTGPVGLPLIYTEGHVARLDNAKGKYWINILSGPGASGGGLFDQNKELVGVVQMGIAGPFDLFGHLIVVANPVQITRFLKGVKWN